MFARNMRRARMYTFVMAFQSTFNVTWLKRALVVFVCLLCCPVHDACGAWNERNQTLSNQYLTLHFSSGMPVRFLDERGQHLLYPSDTSSLILRLNGRHDVVLGRDAAPQQVRGVENGVQFLYNVHDLRVDVTFQLAGPAAVMDITAFNQGRQPVDVALRVLLDTQVATNDGSPFFVEGLGLINREREWRAVPFSSWFGYDRYPDPRVIAFGRFDTPPQRVVMADWRRVDVRRFDYQPTGRNFTHDSAILAYYELGQIRPGTGSRTIRLAYGSGAPVLQDDSLGELIHALRGLRDAAEAKLQQDIDIMARIDAAALTALMNDRAFRERFEALGTGAVVSFARTAVGMAAGSATSVQAGPWGTILFPLSLGVDVSLYGGREARVIDLIERHFVQYLAHLGADWPDQDAVYAVVHEVLTAGVQEGIQSALARLDGLIESLEQGAVAPDEYPFEEVIDLVDRTRMAHLHAMEQESVSIYLAEHGRGMELGLIGALGPHLRAIQAASQTERLARFGEQSARLIGWAGFAGTMGIKIAAAVKTIGISAVAETLIGGSTFVLSNTTKIQAAQIDAASDQLHVTLAGGAKAAWIADMNATINQIHSVVAGVPQARLEGTASALEIVDIQIHADDSSDGMLGVIQGQLVVRNPGPVPVRASGLLVVPGIGSGMPPIAVHGLGQSALVRPGQHVWPLRFVVPTPAALGANRQSYRAIAYVTSGLDDVLLATRDFEIGLISQRTGWRRSEKIVNQVIEAGETIIRTVSVSPDQATVRFWMDYEGSHLDLHVFDPLGRHVGPDYQVGDMQRQIPGSDILVRPTNVDIWIDNPMPGEYRVQVHAVSVHREESVQVSWEELACPPEPEVVAIPPVIMIAPGDRPDLVGVDVVEVTGCHSIGDIEVLGLPATAWRVSRPGGTDERIHLEIRSPHLLLERGVDHIEIRAGSLSLPLRIETQSGPALPMARDLVPFITEFRERRNAMLQQEGLGRDLWEVTAPGSSVHEDMPYWTPPSLEFRRHLPRPVQGRGGDNTLLVLALVGLGLAILCIVLAAGGICAYAFLSDKTNAKKQHRKAENSGKRA
jgi:hypothetical protein